MKKVILLAALSLMTLLVLTQCKQKSDDKAPAAAVNSNQHNITVKEAINASAYTYLFVDEGGKEYWIAIPAMEVVIGKKYFYENGIEMKKFVSKELKRTFESVFFVEQIGEIPDPTSKKTTEQDPNVKDKKIVAGITSNKLMEGLKLPKEAITLNDLLANKEKYAGKVVTVIGKVVRYTPQVLYKNWIHIQDGTSFKGINDVAISSLAKMKIDDIVILKGTVILNKDLGSGYKYDILIEDALIVK